MGLSPSPTVSETMEVPHGRSVRLVLVVVVVFSVGCVGLFEGSESAETLTPAPVPTTQPAPAPGVAGDAAVDGTQLVAANDRRLNSTSYRFVRTVSVDGTNSSIVIDRVRRVQANGIGRERLSANGSGLLTPTVRNWTLWNDGDVVWRRANLTNGRTVTNSVPTGDDGPFDAGRDLAATTFDTEGYRIVARTPRGVVLESTGAFNLTDRVFPTGIGPPRNETARAVVTERGVIRNLTVTYRGDFYGEQVRVRISQRVTGLGNTTATRPAWVPENNTTVMTVPGGGANRSTEE
jgi:hypothetical protein